MDRHQVDGSADLIHCSDWDGIEVDGLLGDFQGTEGHLAAKSTEWIQAGTSKCDQKRHVYCIDGQVNPTSGSQ